MSASNSKSPTVMLWGFDPRAGGPVARYKSQAKHVIWIGSSEASEFDVMQVIRTNVPVKGEKPQPHRFTEEEYARFKSFYARHWYPQHHSDGWYKKRVDKLAQFFFELLTEKNVQRIIFNNIPHEGPDYILTLVAKTLNVKCIFFYQCLFAPLSYVTDQFNIFDRDMFNWVKSQCDLPIDEDQVQKLIESSTANLGSWFFMESTKKPTTSFFRRAYKNTVFRKKRLWLNVPILIDTLRYASELKSIRKNSIDADQIKQKYVYFPLHFEPEITAVSFNKLHMTQIHVVELLSKMVPADWLVIVKENPKQSGFMRPPEFFARMNRLKNVRWADLDAPTLKLTQGCEFVATLTGTAGWEALLLGKKVLVFGEAWYRDLKGVTKYTESKKVSDVLAAQPPGDRTAVIEDALEFFKAVTLPICTDTYFAQTMTEDERVTSDENLFQIIRTLGETNSPSPH